METPLSSSEKSDRKVGCLIGCLIVFLLFILLAAILIGTVYYFLFLREKEPGLYFEVYPSALETVDCKDSFECLSDNLEKCAPAEGAAEMGELATAALKILGASQKDSCVVYVKILEVKKLPPELNAIPSFIVENMFENLSMECLVPKDVYQEGIEKTGDYIGANIYEICKSPLFDFMDKIGIEPSK